MTFSRLYTLKEIAFGLKFSTKTLVRKIKPIKKKLSRDGERKRYYSEKEITIIQKFITDNKGQ
jgi:hypothetical protein